MCISLFLVKYSTLKDMKILIVDNLLLMIASCKFSIMFYFVNKEKIVKLMVEYKWLKEKKDAI